MEVTIRQEAGYDLALYGMSLSFKDRAIKPEDWWGMKCVACDYRSHFNKCDHTCDGFKTSEDDRWQRMVKTATANAGRGKGHDKFLRQIMLWIDLEAPRYFFSEFDTYKVGTVAQSESTMHTLSRREMTYEDIHKCDEYDTENVDVFNSFKEARPKATIVDLKRKVPESYLQRRLVTCNYGVLHTIIGQRKNHRLPEWKQFIDAIYEQVEHPELLPKREE